MPLTPADIHNVAFKRPPLGKRGYDEEEVDSFLDEVEQQLIRLIEENEELRGRIRHGGPPAPANGMNAANGGMTAEHAQVAAQLQRAQQDRARAEQQARALQQQLEQAPPAERSATFGSGTSAVMMMAQRTADDHMQEAHRESESMLANARDKSVQIGGEAQRKASDTESDARRRHTEAIANIEIERAALLDEIERLARLAESYQSALNEHVRAQLQWLESAPETAR